MWTAQDVLPPFVDFDDDDTYHGDDGKKYSEFDYGR
jgi:hypothetical protein